MAVDFGGVAEFGVEVGLEAFLGAELFGGDAVGVGVEGVGLDLALWEGWQGVAMALVLVGGRG